MLGFAIFIFILFVFLSIEFKAKKEKEEAKLRAELVKTQYKKESLDWFNAEVLKKRNFEYIFKGKNYIVDISNVRADTVIRYDIAISDLDTNVKTNHSSFCYIQQGNVSGCKTSISQRIEYAIIKHVKSVNFDKMIGVE